MKTAIKNKYLAKFDELNVLATELVVKPSAEEAAYFFDDMLIDAYVEGFEGAQYILGAPLGGIELSRLKEVVNKEYGGVTIQEKLIKYYETLDEKSLNRLLEDEYHRAYATGQLDGAEAVSLGKNLKPTDRKQLKGEILKVWVTAGDEKVRKDHQKLDGVTLPLYDRFIVGDDSALAPGGFQSARLNVNCRCMLDFTYNG